MMLSVFYEDITKFYFDRKKYATWIKKLIETENKKPGTICLIFCSDQYILNINRKFLKHNYLTDIITFDYNADDRLSGDLFINIHQVEENSKKYKQLFIVELSRVIFHGILHLAGYNDKTQEDKDKIHLLENKYLAKFKLINN